MARSKYSRVHQSYYRSTRHADNITDIRFYILVLKNQPAFDVSFRNDNKKNYDEVMASHAS